MKHVADATRGKWDRCIDCKLAQLALKRQEVNSLCLLVSYPLCVTRNQVLVDWGSCAPFNAVS